jgi:hypothetical protein
VPVSVSCQFSVVGGQFGEAGRAACFVEVALSNRQNHDPKRSFGDPYWQLTTSNWQLTDTDTGTDTLLRKCFLNGLAERFAVDPAGGFFGGDLHHRAHLRFGGRPRLGNRLFHQLIDFIGFKWAREILR